METVMGEDIIPGLPAELATLCLAKLPIDAVARGRAVSRVWASALCNYRLTGGLPQGLAVFCRGNLEDVHSKTWRSLCRGDLEDDHSKSWLFLARSNLRSLVIPFESIAAQHDGTCILSSKLQLVATGTPLLLVHAAVRFGDGQEACSQPCGSEIVEDSLLQGFDVWQMKWLNSREAPCIRMPVDRWHFATAHFNKHVYFAGGDGAAGAASSAERLSLDTWTWETLPPMHKERKNNPSGFAIGGCFFVVGGESHMVSHMELDNLPQSGEFYDPSTNLWTLVPDMWPHKLWWAFGGAQEVAVVDDMAYTIDHKLQVVVQLTRDNPSPGNMEWETVGQLPWLEFDEPTMPWMHHLMSVQNELWAIRNNRYDHWAVFAAKPHQVNQGLQWERLPFVIPPSGQITLTNGMNISI